MKYINCTTIVTNRIINNTILFWAINSEQHITVLLNAYEETGAILQLAFTDELKKLKDEFSSLIEAISANTMFNTKSYLAQLLYFNQQFLTILERMKFEAFNGFPKLYQTVLHFIYEQEYVHQIFGYTAKNQNVQMSSVVINNIFNSQLYNKSTLYCIYSNIYFWSLIAAEHTDILEGLLPLKFKKNASVQSLLLKLRNEFNSICFLLSENYKNINIKSLKNIFDKFNEYNTTFLSFLYELDNDNKEDENADIKPTLYIPVLKHIIDEHTYINALCGDYSEYMNR